MRILIIDDQRSFIDDRAATVARSSEEGIFALQDGHWDEVWLDFILEGSDDIMPVINWIEQLGSAKVDVDTFIVHSSSSGAYSLISTILEPLGYKVEPLWARHSANQFRIS